MDATLPARSVTPGSLPRHASYRVMPWGPAWPLQFFLYGFLVWWLLGFAVLGFLVVSLPLGYHLLRRRTVRTPAGFGLYLLFLFWVALSVFVIYAQAPFARPETGASQLLPWLYNFAWFIALAVAILFVGNLSERELSTDAGLWLISALFLSAVVGGYLGILFPATEFPSVVQALAPGVLADNQFFGLLTHVAFSEVQTFLGYVTPRPQAPFIYTNTWGAVFGVSLPFFIVHWGSRSHPRLRRLLPLALLLAAVPVVASLNRGLWVGIGLMAFFVLMRAVFTGRPVVAVSIAVASVLVVLGLSFGPGASLVEDRLQSDVSSNTGRSNLIARSMASMWEGSPLVGFGATRDLSGSFYSISGPNSSASCPSCGAPKMGSQGIAWYLLFGHGIIGLALFGGFLIRRFLSLVTSADGLSVAAAAGSLFIFATSLVYELLDAPLYCLFLGLGLAWRQQQLGQGSGTG